MKNKTLTLLLLLSACSTNHQPAVYTKTGQCVVSKTLNVTTLSCPGQTPVSISDGENAAQPYFDVVTNGLCKTIIMGSEDVNGNIDASRPIKSATVCDGFDGEDGEDATPSPYDIVDIVRPCNGTGHSEVLLVLQNGTVLVSMSGDATGTNTRLGVLTDGTYVTTDGNSCTFTLSNRTITWSGGGVSF